MAKNGAWLVRDAVEVDKIRKVLFIDGVMNRQLVGQPAGRVAELAGIAIPEGTSVIVVEGAGIGEADILCQEKMCPVLTVFRYKTFEEAMAMALANLDVEGRGHSISVHSRVLINQICSTMNGGSFYNGFAATTTLGCGSWGNNSISENLDYKHLMNITRIGRYLKDAIVPTDAQIWG
jgi:succinate-semialdehyde dehydrogenase